VQNSESERNLFLNGTSETLGGLLISFKAAVRFGSPGVVTNFR